MNVTRLFSNRTPTSTHQVANQADLEVVQPPNLALDGVHIQQRLRTEGIVALQQRLPSAQLKCRCRLHRASN